MEKLETKIVHTISKLEMILSLSFFDSIEHIPINLSFKVKVEALA
jgi:hypothetical protein